MCRLLVTASFVPSSPILVTLMKEALSYSESSVLTRATWHKIPEDTILQDDKLLFTNAPQLETTEPHTQLITKHLGLLDHEVENSISYNA
jgi:hypothetical protein